MLVVSYTGFDSTSRPVNAVVGRDAAVQIEMSSGPVGMDAYVVNFRRGEADEIMLRRQAPNVVDVVSSKNFGEMADGSLSISRLAGMTGGTGIRGIAGEFNLVRVDGGALATPSDSTASGTTRGVDINQIPGDMIERIEVTKSPRPDMDADAVGGTINLITKARRREWPDGLGNYQFDLTGSIVRVDRTDDFLHPKITFLGGTSPANVDAVGTVSLLQLLDATQIEEQAGLTLHVERALPTRIPISIKSGLRYREVVRDIDRGEHQYTYLGKNADFIGTKSINPFGLYESSFVPNISLVRESLKTHPELWRENLLLYIQKQNEHNGHAGERIEGAYVMADVRLGKFAFLPGDRAEWTQFKGTATVQDEGQDGTPGEWTNRATQKGRYSNVFPHLHTKYELWDDIVIRASWSTGIGRPPWKNILPEGVISPESRSITRNNSNLRPQYTNNFDLGAEYYFKSGGLFGVNFFRKEIRDLIFQSSRLVVPEDNLGAAYEGWMLTTSDNAAWAWVQGVEFDFRQQLTMLPGWMNRFGVFANLTLLDTAGNYSTPDGSVTSNIPGFVPRVANAGISYTGKKLNLRVQGQYRDEALSTEDGR